MATKYQRGTGEEDPGHPSQDGTARFPLDQLLRDRGWEIWSRPGAGREPVWRKRVSPREYLEQPEQAILLTLPKIDIDNALLEEALRGEGLA